MLYVTLDLFALSIHLSKTHFKHFFEEKSGGFSLLLKKETLNLLIYLNLAKKKPLTLQKIFRLITRKGTDNCLIHINILWIYKYKNQSLPTYDIP